MRGRQKAASVMPPTFQLYIERAMCSKIFVSTFFTSRSYHIGCNADVLSTFGRGSHLLELLIRRPALGALLAEGAEEQLSNEEHGAVGGAIRPQRRRVPE